MHRFDDRGAGSRNAGSPGPGSRSALSRLSRRIAALSPRCTPPDSDATRPAGRAMRGVLPASVVLTVWACATLDITVAQAGGVFVGAIVVLSTTAALIGWAAQYMPALDEWGVGLLVVAAAACYGAVHVLL